MAALSAFQAWMSDFAQVIGQNAEHLTDLDRAIGDGDHGSNMTRGTSKTAALAEAEEFDNSAAYLKKVGMTLVSNVGGASGPLFGTFFLRLGGALGDAEDIDAATFGKALHAGVGGVLARGKAEVGDKTMFDAWSPALEAYDAAVTDGGDLQAALQAAVDGAKQGRDATVDLVARKGRASYLGERSKGHQDPGATSTVLLLESALRTLA